MARRVSWSKEAESDLEYIAQYIARDSHAYASAVVRRVVTSTRKLARFPRIGRVVPEVSDDNCRELLVDSYRVIYVLAADQVTVITIVHMKQSLDLG